MKRTLIATLVAILALPLFGQDDEPRQTWLVATRVPASVVMDATSGVPEIRESRTGRARTLRSRTVASFRHVDGFAAELTETEAKELATSPLVRWVEKNHTRAISSSAPVISGALDSAVQITPYGITMVGAPEAWKGSRGRTVKVGVIDTGIDRNHPDLAARYKGGYDFVNFDDDPQDDNGHGTHVAGTIAAIDNDLGVVGVAPEADLYALKSLNQNGSGTVLTLVSAVEWAIDNDLDVVSMSLGSAFSSELELEVFARAEAAGIICVAASGNAGIETLDFPAAYPTVISVGAVNSVESLASFSQRGADLDFVAPGVAVDSTNFRTYYGISTSDGKILRAEPMAYSPSGTVSGKLVDCRSGFAGDCPPETRGEIALIERGSTTFAEKAMRAQDAGARAVVIYNHHHDTAPEGGIVIGTLGSPGSWPLTVGISRSSGLHLLGLADKMVTMSPFSVSEYGKKNGTSMATPHVSGAVALLRALAPDATKFQIMEALRLTSRDLGTAGWDAWYGNGRIDVNQAARYLAPNAFTEEEPRRRTIRRAGSGN